MGICGGKLSEEDAKRLADERAKSSKIDSVLVKDFQKGMSISKLLLLGAGESGKSTLFKQLITIYGRGFSEDDRRSYTNIILQNVITSMKTLLHQAQLLETQFPDCKLSASSRAIKGQVEDLKDSDDLNSTARQLTDPVAKVIAQLWDDPAIRATMCHRAKYQLPDSAGYFFGRVFALAKPDYVPDQQDILRVRARTTGIVENSFDIGSNRFKMFDVGGQRNERKKWMHCFENVTAVMFVAALSEYDQALYEDESTNRMVEALNLWDETCNNRFFRDTAVILFLNKRDLFLEKINVSPISLYFQEYAGSSPEEAVEFFQQHFEARNHTGKRIYCHTTCATDQDNVNQVFGDVKDIIVKRSLAEAGLVLV